MKRNDIKNGMNFSPRKFFYFQGFSLLELLFVTAVIAVIALAGISTYRQRTLNVKVDHAVLEIQKILKAGAVFFLNQGKWPKAGEQSGDLFQKQYLISDKALINPWDKYYQYEPFSLVQTEPEKIRLFQVETIVPTEGIANQIAAKLPNSEVESTESAYRVRIQLLLAADEGQNKKQQLQYLFHSVGTVDLTKEDATKSHIVKVAFNPPCPKDMKPGVLVGFVRVTAKNDSENLLAFEVVDKQCDTNKCEFRVRLLYLNNFYCLWNHFISKCWTEDKKVTVKYIAYCEQLKT